MKTYRVYFEQINYTMIEVTAKSRTSAIAKAEKEWRRDYAHPTVSGVEEKENPK